MANIVITSYSIHYTKLYDHVVAILRSWDFSATTPLQYALEKRAYLAQLITLFTLARNNFV